MPYLFTPPQRIETVTVPGTHALRWKLYVSLTVYKNSAGTWVAVETPATEDLEAAQQLLATSGRPQVVDDVTGAALAAAGPLVTDSSHTPATCIPIGV